MKQTIVIHKTAGQTIGQWFKSSAAAKRHVKAIRANAEFVFMHDEKTYRQFIESQMANMVLVNG